MDAKAANGGTESTDFAGKSPEEKSTDFADSRKTTKGTPGPLGSEDRKAKGLVN
jgi:hypothetical protein